MVSYVKRLACFKYKSFKAPKSTSNIKVVENIFSRDLKQKQNTNTEICRKQKKICTKIQ